MQILKKSMAALLACAMLLTLLPAAALAASPVEDIPDASPAEEAVAVLADVYSGVCGTRNEDSSYGDNITWSLNSSTGVLNISGSGAMADFSSFDDIPWGGHRSLVKNVIVSGGITYLGRGAFEFLPNLERATLADSVAATGNYLFYSDASLRYVSMPAALEDLAWGTFRGCSSLTSSTVPAACTNLHGEAYYDCVSLETVSIPADVTIIGDTAFHGCSALKSVIFAGSQIAWAAIEVGTDNDALLGAAITINGDPANVENVTAAASGRGILVGWDAALNCTGYRVLRKTASTDYITIAEVEGTSYFDSTAKENTVYTYTVFGINGPAVSPSSVSEASASWSSAPANVTLVSAVAGDTGITVTWEEAANAVTYRVYRKTEGGSWKTLTSETAGTSYVDTTAKAGTEYIYTVRALNADGVLSPSYDKNGVKAKIENSISISGQPQNATSSVGDTAQFSITATGSNLTYQWQFKSSAGASWKNNTTMAGCKTAMLSVPATKARDGYQYRCVITSGSNTIYSDPATLTVKEGFAITSQPQNSTASLGDTVQFTVTATGSNLTYQWQYKSSAGADWKNNTTMAGCKTATLTVPVTIARNGYQYRCVVTSSSNVITSDAATLTVKANLAITSQPKNVTTSVGDTAKFTVTATGSNLTYQWQYKSSADAEWKNNTTMVGCKTAALSVPVTVARNGYQYRCVITSGSNMIYSNSATLTVMEGLTITSQPLNVTASVGDTVKFTVTATGSNLTYQWQYKSSAGADWKNNTTMAGCKTATLTVPATAARNGYQYRCVVMSRSNAINSNAATLTVKANLTITGQPQNATASVGDTAKFTVIATGNNLTYQWQYKSSAGAEWTNNTTMAGCKTATLSVPVTVARNGYQYRCMITSGINVLYSDAAILTLKASVPYAVTG